MGQWRGMHLHDRAPVAATASVTCDVYQINRLWPRRQAMQDRGGSMADDGPIVQLRHCGQDQLAMLIGTRALRWSIAYIGTPAHRDQATVALHPSQVTPVVALAPESPS